MLELVELGLLPADWELRRVKGLHGRISPLSSSTYMEHELLEDRIKHKSIHYIIMHQQQCLEKLRGGGVES